MKKRIMAAALLAFFLVAASCTREVSGESATQENPLESGVQTEDGTEETVGATTGTAGYNYMGSDLSPYIAVGNYRGLTVETRSAEMTEEEYEEQLALLLDSFAQYEQITDRTVEEGDTVVADYAGSVDGVAFDGGTAVGAEVTVEPNSGYIEGFAEAFVGRTPGEEFSFDVTFPKVYGNLDLAGKEATFVCTVQYIRGTERITPALDDAFVSANFGYGSVEEFETVFREAVEQQKRDTVENERYTALWSQVMDNATVLAYPEGEVDRIFNQYSNVYRAYAEANNLEYTDFLENYLGIGEEEIRLMAENYVKESLVMYQIAKELGVVVTEEELNAEAARIAAQYDVEAEELLSAEGQKNEIMISAMLNEVLKGIAAEANLVETEE